MRRRIVLGASLVALSYLGLVGSPSGWGGLTEVPVSQADALIGGAACPSFASIKCGVSSTSTTCPTNSGYLAGIRASGTLSGTVYCGTYTGCSGVTMSTTATICGG